MVCVAVCVVINLRFLGLKSHNILDMEGEYSEMCDVEKDYVCICCSGAYDSFDSIASVIEEKQKVKITEKIEEKVKKIKATKGPATQEQIERRLKEQIRKEEEEEAAFLRRTGVLERSPNEKLMDAYFKKIEIEAELQQSCPIMIKSPCELLKSGSATCQCTECRGSHSDDGSVHSEDCLDLLPTTHV
jgi:hypothetical protein